MAKLFLATVVKNNNNNYIPSCDLYLNTKNVQWAGSVIYTDSTGATATGTQIIYYGYDGTYTVDYVSSDSLSTIQTRMNAAFTTDVHTLSLTKIDDFAGAAPTASQLSQLQVNVDDIWMVMTHPLYAPDAIVQIQNPTKSLITPNRTADTASAIETAANA